MREIFNTLGGHGASQSLDDITKLIEHLKGQKQDTGNKLGLHEFGYLFKHLADNPENRLEEGAETIEALKKLGAAMADPLPQSDNNTTIPAGYTYLGQFIDHDITRDAQAGNLNDTIKQPLFDPVLSDEASAMMKNVRTATLELDSVYGAGPIDDPSMYESDGVHLRVGTNRNDDGLGSPEHISNATLSRDLFREDNGTPVIGDNRNDENLLVAQTHHAFKTFHNKVVDHLSSSISDSTELFNQARKTVVQHYQWIVIKDFLPRIVTPESLDSALKNPRFYKQDLPTFMPFEFSVAAYRFGHSMIRQRYDHNSIFGPEITDFSLLFAFTSGGREEMPVPQSWIINWRNFYDFGSPPANFARPIDSRLSSELERLPNEQGLMAMLSTRNLLRGYLMSLPTGQSVAREIGAPPLTTDELELGATEIELSALNSASLSERTPLWFYILKEASVREGGQRLGDVGSTIVAETLVALVKRSEHSILTDPQWQPELGSRPGIFEMADLLAFCDFEETRSFTTRNNQHVSRRHGSTATDMA